MKNAMIGGREVNGIVVVKHEKVTVHACRLKVPWKHRRKKKNKKKQGVGNPLRTKMDLEGIKSFRFMSV